MRIANKRKVIKYRYLLHNVILKEVSNAKYLGVTMNTRLLWKKHVHEICGKDNQTRQFLQRNLVACKAETKLQCYKIFMRPIVEYSSSVWDPVGNNQLTKQIESVQGKAARWITSSKKWSALGHFNPKLIKHNFLNQILWSVLGHFRPNLNSHSC